MSRPPRSRRALTLDRQCVELCWFRLASAVRANVGGRSRDRRKRLPGAALDYALREQLGRNSDGGAEVSATLWEKDRPSPNSAASQRRSQMPDMTDGPEQGGLRPTSGDPLDKRSC